VDKERRRDMPRTILAAAVVLVLCAGVASATTVTYTSRPLWNIALANIPVVATLTEDFNDGLVNQTWLSVASTVGTVTAFQWSDVIDASPLKTTTWSWAVPMVGFGGDFDLYNPGGPGTGIDIWADFGSGLTYVMSVPNSAADTFYGFISTAAFTDVKFVQGSLGGVQETYYLDDLSYAWVPEPGTFFLLGTGLVGLGLVARRRRKK